MRPELNRRRLFTRRAFVLGGLQGLMVTSLLGRAYYLQMLRSEEYTTLSDQNRLKLLLVTPERGRILDRNGVALAENEKNYRLLLQAQQQSSITPVTIAPLAEILEADPMVLSEQIRKRRPEQDVIVVAEQLSWEQLSAVEVRAPELPGMSIDVGTLRHYPHVDVTAHLAGYVGAPTEQDGDVRFFRRLPELKVGKRGIEKTYETRLRGVPGIRRQEVNATGGVVRSAVAQTGTPGDTLTTSIDMELQIFAHQRLSQEKSSAAVVLNARTGEVLALASTPSFDPNQFSKGISQTDWNALLNNPRTPLMNKCIAGQYPPGSTYKMIVGLAGLKAGAINEHTRYHCPGHMDLGNHRFHCWKRTGHGGVTLRDAIEQSCDVYFYNVALKIGQDAVAEMARRLGLGKATGLDLPGEQAGLIPDPAWKLRRRKQEWQRGDTVNASIGQGYVLATPIQLAVMIAQLANGGHRIVPNTLPAPRAPDGSEMPLGPSLGIDPAHLALVMDGTFGVVNRGTGTAYGKRIMEPGMTFGGKTGTSQVRALSKLKGISKEDQEWTHQHHALFVGYAPVENPQFAMAVVVEHGGSGSGAAAPIARDLLLKTQQVFAAPVDATAPVTDTPVTDSESDYTPPSTMPEEPQDAATIPTPSESRTRE